jgi:glycosyltransferase involved in cell wall biosynthesis
MKKINFLYFIEGLNLGGQQSFYYNVFKHVSDDMNISVAYLKEQDDMLDHYMEFAVKADRIGDGDALIYANFGGMMKYVKLIYKLSVYVKKNEIDFIACNAFVTFMVANAVSLLTGTKCVRFIGGDLRRSGAKYFNNRFLSFIYKIPTKYFGYSFMYQELVKRGVNPNKMAWKYSGHGVDTELFKPAPELVDDLKQELGIPPSTIVIGWIGRLPHIKEIFETIDVLKELKKLSIDFRFLIVGDGPARGRVEEELSQIDALKQTILLGFVPYREVYRYINVMDIVPLLDEDPHGGSIIREAMACGKVVITTDGASGVQRGLVDNNLSGILVLPEDRVSEAAKAIRDLFSNPGKINRIGIAARDKAVKELSFSHLGKVVSDEVSMLQTRG